MVVVVVDRRTERMNRYLLPFIATLAFIGLAVAALQQDTHWWNYAGAAVALAVLCLVWVRVVRRAPDVGRQQL